MNCYKKINHALQVGVIGIVSTYSIGTLVVKVTTISYMNHCSIIRVLKASLTNACPPSGLKRTSGGLGQIGRGAISVICPQGFHRTKFVILPHDIFHRRGFEPLLLVSTNPLSKSTFSHHRYDTEEWHWIYVEMSIFRKCSRYKCCLRESCPVNRALFST